MTASDDFVALLRAERASAILRCHDAAVARRAMEAAVRGGFRVVEFTLTIPRAVELIQEFAARRDLVVGAGTVLTPSQARDAVQAGARFLVSPVVDESVIATARELGVAAIPGTFTPTEMLRAHRAGAPLVKLFPSPGAGPLYVKQILGPLPELKIVPTAGVDASNSRAYLEAGAWAVGFVSSLFDAGEMAEGRFDAIESRARALRGSLT
jgi:2-dehydro-3-deoxyphosphogluconate aldolase/(4S)-4-hydroxy-2-oxoglutarate aldolase